MNEIKNENVKKPGILSIMFKPFNYVAGSKSLIIGLSVIVVSGIIGSFSNTHFDGVLDVHIGMKIPLWLFVAEGIINWISMSVIILLAGLTISKTKFRVIDVLGTQSLARFPMIFVALVTLLPGFKNFAEKVALQPESFNQFVSQYPGEFTAFLAVMVVIILSTVWMVYLMYHSFSVSCNVKKLKAIITFIVSIILAEILSKIIIVAAFKAILY